MLSNNGIYELIQRRMDSCSATRLGWETKIKSMQEDDAGNV